MGDFVYNGSHAITFIVAEDTDYEGAEDFKALNTYNTWSDWHMAPKSRPFVAAPTVKTAYVDVPGADGSLDYTDALAGKARYANRTGSWEFIIDNGYINWFEVYSDILQKLHGKYFDRIILDDEPEYYWKGRLSVKGDFSPRDYNMVTIEYNLDPYKRPIDAKAVNWWRWNSLFGNLITYGPFQVNGTKSRNFINDGSTDIVANMNVTSAMDMFPYDGTKYMQDQMFINKFYNNPDLFDVIHLETGDNEFVIKPGDNYYMFYGTGNVNVEYERGKLL